jgi:hypothetical protein
LGLVVVARVWSAVQRADEVDVLGLVGEQFRVHGIG